MSGTLLVHEPVLGCAVHLALRDFLEPRLGAHRPEREGRRDVLAERIDHEGMGGVIARVEIERAHHRLEDVLERGVHAARTGAPLRLPHHDEGRDPEVAGHLRERLAGDERDLDARELALVHGGKALEEVGGHDGAEDRVAEKLQALVRGGDGLALHGGRMRDGGLDE